MGWGGVGCSAQVEMVPIACASLVANATARPQNDKKCFIHFCILLIMCDKVKESNRCTLIRFLLHRSLL